MESKNQTEQQTPHKRRVRYKGTHPTKFSEKYKEHNPEKYADVIEHVIQKGSTPAGMHISIMVQEILDVLKIRPGETGLDCTLGYGGHTKAMLGKLEGRGHLYALDIDTIEMEKTRRRLQEQGFGPEILTIQYRNFADIDLAAKDAGGFDFILADLGVSSMQIDNPERGFSYKVDGPLDLRLDSSKGETAAQRLARLDRDELEGMLTENSDEPYAGQITNAIMNELRKGRTIETTTRLREIIEATIFGLPQKVLPEKDRRETAKKSCARVFQALRIDVNSEFEVLYSFLEKLPDALKPGGRAAILTFHSGEDRLVKKAFKEGKRSGLYAAVSEEVIRPGQEECVRNPRAKSTKLRWAVKE